MVFRAYNTGLSRVSYAAVLYRATIVHAVFITYETCVLCDYICSYLVNDASVSFGQASNGGVFNVELGSSATVNVPSAFDHNSVQAEYSGGAVYAGGKVKQSLFDTR